MSNDPHAEIARRSRRSFMALGGGAVAGMAGWWALNRNPPEGDPGPGTTASAASPACPGNPPSGHRAPIPLYRIICFT